MAHATVLDVTGATAGERELPDALFGGEVNVPLLHQVVTAQLAAARSGTSKTKTRSEVRGGGSKPWRQKGTGRARHGSIRSPIWVGGGTVFGPQPRSYRQRTPKKMRRAALRAALATKAEEGRIFVLQGFTEPKTKAAARLLKGAGIDGRFLVVLDPGADDDAYVDRAFRNRPGGAFTLYGSLSTYDVLVADAVIFTASALDRYAGPSADAGGAGGDAS